MSTKLRPILITIFLALVASCSGASGTTTETGTGSLKTGTAPPLPSADRNDFGRLVDAIAASARILPREEFDVAARAKALNNDPSRIFDWVRDQTWWAPYRGLLRGSKGVMLDRVGSSLDRAILLGDLLKQSGLGVRLARAQLSESRARELLTTIRPIPDRGVRTARVSPASTTSGTAAPDLAKYLEATAADVTRRAADASNVVQSNQRQLMSALQTHASTPADDERAVIAALQDHWWVERQEAGQWVAMDILVPDGKTGASVSAAAASVEWKPDASLPAVPAADWHTVQIRVVVERYEGGATSESTVLEKTLRPIEVIDRPVALFHSPTPWPAGLASVPDALRKAILDVSEWTPVLRVGRDVTVMSSFTSTGDIKKPYGGRVPNRVTDAFGGLDSALGGGGGSSSFATAEWLDYEIRIPGADQPQRIRRTVFDLLGPARRAAKAADFDGDAEAARLARSQILAAVTDIFMAPCELTPEFVADVVSRTLIANQAAFQQLAAERDPAQAKRIARSILGRVDHWSPLLDLGLWRSQLGASSSDWFIDRPNIFNHRFTPDIADPSRSRALIDIAANRIGVRPAARARAFEARLTQGIADTVAEVMALGDEPRSADNTAAFFAMTSSDPRVVLKPRDTGATSGLGWSADVAARLTAQVNEGFMAIAMNKPVTSGSQPRVGWWRIDPRSGDTIGVMDTGFHQDTLEQAIQTIRDFLEEASLNPVGVQRKMAVQGSSVASDMAYIQQMRVTCMELLADLLKVGLI